MATFLDRLLAEVGVDLPAAAPDFADVAGGVHAPAIGRLAAAGVVRGTGPDTFNSAGVVTREQMASFLMRAADLMAAEGVTEPPYLEGGDNGDNGDGTEDGCGTEPPALEPGVATGECSDPEVILAESGSIDEPGAVVDYPIEVTEGQRVSFRSDDFSFNVRWALIDQDGDAIFSNTSGNQVVTFDRAGRPPGGRQRAAGGAGA